MNATVHQVADGCYAWLRLPGNWGQTNIGLVTGRGSSLLIDTPWDLRLTQSMVTAFTPHTEQAPISLVLNTHADPDHWWGNAGIGEAEIVAATGCATAMRAEASPRRLDALRRVASLSGRLPGRLGDAGRYVDAMLSPFAFAEVTPRFPDRTFTGQRTERVGGREVVFVDYGAAHTKSDSVVVVPDARVVFTGDLVFAGVTPLIWHGPLPGWLTALDAILDLDVEVFVPGHGPVATRAELHALRDYWTWLGPAVAAARDAGKSVFETARRLITTPEFGAFCGWDSAERLYLNVATIRRQLDGGGPLPSDLVTRTRTFDGVARVQHLLETSR